METRGFEDLMLNALVSHSRVHRRGRRVIIMMTGSASTFVGVLQVPVDGRGPAVLREQGSMQVDSAQGRPVPNGFWKHPERHYHAQVCIPCIKHGMEVRRLQRP